MKYRSGYKYQLEEDYEVKLEFAPDATIRHSHLVFYPDGTLRIFRGFLWDGPSGPALDTKTFMVASLVHDALYLMMRFGVLDQSYRKLADRAMYRLARRSGMWPPRALWSLLAVRLFASSAAAPDNIRPIEEAS